MKGKTYTGTGGNMKRVVAFVVVAICLVVLFFVAVNTGSLEVTIPQLFRGLFVEYDQTVATIWNLRFPRILISMMAGASLAVSGVLLQAVLKNPLADPGIIGVTSGAGFFAVVISAFLPQLFFFTPLFACIGGFVAFFLVYSLAWKGSLSPVRIILVGVAVDAMFGGLSDVMGSAGQMSSVSSIISSNITMKTWSDVRVLAAYGIPALVLSFLTVRLCNLMALEDKTARGLGVNITRNRLVVSAVAVMLAAVTTAVAGSVSFLGLIVPHMGRLLVGHDHKYLIPFSALSGATVYLLADTLGRRIVYPAELSAAVLMAVIGGPFFILLLRRSKTYGS